MHRRAFITATAAAATVATLKGATAATVPPLGATGVPVRPGEALPLGPLPGGRYPDPHVEFLVKPKGAFGASGFPAFAGTMAVERVATGFRWAEGPVYFPAGRYVLFSDIPNNRIMRYCEDDGHVSVFRQPSMNSNGNTIDREGRLITCEHGGRRVTRTELDGTITIIADKYNGKRLNSPNDAAVAADGSIWFTDPVYGIGGNYEGVKSAPEQDKHNVYRVDPKSGDIKVVVDDFVEPNGIAFSPDEKKLYVIDTGFTDGPNNPSHIRVFDVDLEGGKLIERQGVCRNAQAQHHRRRAHRHRRQCLVLASVGATPTKTAFAATMPAATCSAKSISRRRSPISASAAPSETDCISAARARSTRSIPARPAP